MTSLYSYDVSPLPPLVLQSEYLFHLSGSNSIYVMWRKGGSNASTFPPHPYSFHFLQRVYLFLKSAHGEWKYGACPHFLTPNDKYGWELVTATVNEILVFRDGKDLGRLLGCSDRMTVEWILLGCSDRMRVEWIPKRIVRYRTKER
jgi:hypothetical protein